MYLFHYFADIYVILFHNFLSKFLQSGFFEKINIILVMSNPIITKHLGGNGLSKRVLGVTVEIIVLALGYLGVYIQIHCTILCYSFPYVGRKCLYWL